MIIYADLIFFAEFFGDFLCLTLASSICGRIPLWRRILAAMLGGVYGVCAAMPQMAVLGGAAAKAVCLVLMAAAALVPCSGGELIRGGMCFVLSSMLLSGGAQLLAVSGGIPLYLTLFGVCCMTFCALAALRNRIYARYIPCILCLGKKRVHTCGFYDSGNKLYAENGSDCVIVADERILKRLFGDGVTAANLCEFADVTQVEYRGVADGKICGVKLDCAYVGARRFRNVVLAVSGNKIEDRVILHSTMV